ncbi:MAG: hypothetical protein AAGI07_14380, partial [Bacteroidota bacterium]
MIVEDIQLYSPLERLIESCMLIDSDNLTHYIPLTVGYPEVTTEFIIILAGHFNFAYKGKLSSINESCFFSLIDKLSLIIPSKKLRIIRMVFRPLGVYPLVRLSDVAAKEWTTMPLFPAKDIFGSAILDLESILYSLDNKY